MAEPTLSAALRELAATRRLLVTLDFDGVLAPIVTDPAAARPLPEAADAIRRLSMLPDTTVALISGRGLADLIAVSGMSRPVRLVGSHGAEFDAGGIDALGPPQRALRERLRAGLEPIVRDAPGAALEDKPAGIAVHVRRAAPDVRENVLAAVRSGPARWQGVSVTEGKAVIDLAVVAMDKGAALQELRRQTAATAVMFVGDDVTDEKAFARLSGPDLGVKVGDGETLARHRVPEPSDVAVLLAELLGARTARTAAG